MTKTTRNRLVIKISFFICSFRTD